MTCLSSSHADAVLEETCDDRMLPKLCSVSLDQGLPKQGLVHVDDGRVVPDGEPGLLHGRQHRAVRRPEHALHHHPKLAGHQAAAELAHVGQVEVVVAVDEGELPLVGEAGLVERHLQHLLPVGERLPVVERFPRRRVKEMDRSFVCLVPVEIAVIDILETMLPYGHTIRAQADDLPEVKKLSILFVW